MRMTFVLPGRSTRYPIGGYKVVYEYANGLVKRNHEVNVIHPLLAYPEKADYKDKLRMYCKWAASFFLGTPKIKWFDISPKVKMLSIPTPEEKYIPPADVIIATAWETAEWVSKYGTDKGEKFYLIQHYENWSGSEDRILATWKKPLKKIVIAHWLEEIAHKIGEDDVAYIPNGINFNHFSIITPIAERDRQKVGMLYSHANWKGSKEGIAALEMAKKKVPDLKAVFFSTSPKGPEVPTWIEFYQNPSPNNLLEIYNSCGIFISPSWYEGWCLPSAEAMACGCALATTDSLGVREYAFNEKTALISAPKNPEELARNIIRLIQDNNLRISLAESGHRFIQNFTWEKAVNEFEKTISDQK